jgi:hypothetical protein
MKTIEDKKIVLDRSRLRDLILILSFISAGFCSITETELVAGFLLLAFGCFLHVVAKGILRRNVVLCQDGIYGMVRNPYYLSSYIIDSSFCLLSGNQFLLLVYPFLFFWAYGPTIRKEEKFLSAHHADQFMKYSEVAQIFPDRTSVARIRTLFDGFSWQRVSWKEYARVTRFGSLGIFITLVHSVTAHLLSRLHWAGSMQFGLKDFLFAVVACVLYLSSLILARIARRDEPVTQSQ